jgi:SAM-dependent methyltransferase
MAHTSQTDFCKKIKERFPHHFKDKRVLDVGSQEILKGGNNRFLFTDCQILGIDLGPGDNVDKIVHGADLALPPDSFDTIISTEAFEHDSRFGESLRNIVRLLVPKGMFLFTCAAEYEENGKIIGRGEHGTHRSADWASPHTLDFYKNRTEQETRSVINIDEVFSEYEFETLRSNCFGQPDLYFWGIKNG